ncbi:MAG TPA: M28 family peptidase, partial [Ferruginibacter sp.]|nr:M28 family peptidase [Ferruginibacter sp.]
MEKGNKWICWNVRAMVFLGGMMVTIGLRAQSDPERIQALVSNSLQQGKAYEWLYRLCKHIGPRLSGSTGAARAVDSTAKWLKEAGADTVYRQACLVPHWERGKAASARVFIQGKYYQDLKVCALGNSVGSDGQTIQAEIVEVTSLAALESVAPEALKGKIVFFNQVMDPTKIRTFEAYGAAGASRRSGAARAARYGALAVLVRSLSSNIDAYPHTGATQYNDSFPRIPALAVATEDAEWLHQALQANGRLSVAVTSGARLLPDVPSFNVIAEIKGSQFPEEIITVGGHLDSWDLAEGAHDDGAGCVQSIE